MSKFKTLNSICAASLLALLATPVISSPAWADDAPVLKIENFIGTVEIVTSNTGKITINDADGANVIRSGSDLTIDDDISIRSYNCNYRKDRAYIGKGKWRWNSGGKGYRSLDEYPSVKISAPAQVHVEIERSIIFGDVGDIGSAHLHIGSCGDMKFGDVNGRLDLAVSGSGDVIFGNAGISDIGVSGSGDVMGNNLASADIHVSGSGDLELGDIAGAVDIGSSGAGDVELGSISGGLDLHSSGSSDFEADSVSGGNLSIRVSGSSDVTIKDGNVDTLFIKASGASDVTYGGKSVDAEARASGASDINIHNPSGNLRASDSGAADVNIR